MELDAECHTKTSNAPKNHGRSSYIVTIVVPGLTALFVVALGASVWYYRFGCVSGERATTRRGNVTYSAVEDDPDTSTELSQVVTVDGNHALGYNSTDLWNKFVSSMTKQKGLRVIPSSELELQREIASRG